MTPIRKSRQILFSCRFSLIAVGPERSEDQIQDEVDQSLEEALAEIADKRVRAAAEPEGAFLAAGVEWLWLLSLVPYAKAAALGLAGAIGKKTGDKLFAVFSEKLRCRNLLAKKLPGNALVGAKQSTKSRNAKADSAKSNEKTKKRR